MIGPTTGMTEALAGLQRLSAADLSRVLAAESRRLVAVAQPYPPEVPGQRYRRTFTLHDAWNPIAPSRSAGGWEAGAENATVYADYVMGDAQRRDFAGRWRTTDDIADTEADAVAAAVEAELSRLIGAM